ncbi:MAG: hypothetical protein NVV82_23365 [Sporocytophaga sp.]|nr:hypothetical protein [Sporocytophaga sp.]
MKGTDYAIVDGVELSYSVSSINTPLVTEVVGSNVISDKLELKSKVDELNNSILLACLCFLLLIRMLLILHLASGHLFWFYDEG